jgi:hypothetical protein
MKQLREYACTPPLQEISATAGMRGGPGRIRTSNQTVMSAVTLSETPIKSAVFRHTNQQTFTIGCGQSLAKHWLVRQGPSHKRSGLRSPALASSMIRAAVILLA